MQLQFTSVLVQNQSTALRFYTEKLGFRKMTDLPMGKFRWLTVKSPDGFEDVEIILEPFAIPLAEECQKFFFKGEVPVIDLIAKDIFAQYQNLKKSGVVFRKKPEKTGVGASAIFEDTCGNLINLVPPAIQG